MKKIKISRRVFLSAASAGAVAAVTSSNAGPFLKTSSAARPVLLGGEALRTSEWPSWPVWDRTAEEEILQVLRSGDWFRGRGTKVDEFEQQYAEMMGSKRCLATASGTTALLVALHALGIEAGDEVIVSPFTFIATYNVVFLSKALPVFTDTDVETFTIDPAKIEEKITERTKAILPVHIYGLPCDMESINAIAKKHNLVVIEDACQAWLAEYQNKKCGTVGDLGCFSFQNSKHLPAGEGGAVIGDNEEIMDLCQSFHNCGRPYGSVEGIGKYPIRGSNHRMQQFQAVILMSQLKRLEKDTALRLENANYLTSKIKDIPGIITHKMANGATKAAYHLYPFRYKKEQFDDLPKASFIRALKAEGIPCSSGYHPQYRDGLVEETLQSRGYKRLFSEQRLESYRRDLHLPLNDQLCDETVAFYQSMLLGTKKDMDDIADAILKIYEHRKELSLV